MKIRPMILAAALLLTGCGSVQQPAAKPLPPQISAEMLQQRGVTIEQDSAGKVLYLTGSITDDPIETESDAADTAAALSDLLGCDNFCGEFRFTEKRSRMNLDIYSYAQYYEGIPVLNGTVTLSVNAETHIIESIRSSYIPGIQLNTEPEISRHDAMKAAKKELPELPGGDELQTPVLVIESQTADVCLIWQIKNEDGAEVWIDANTGAVLYSFNGAFPD